MEKFFPKRFFTLVSFLLVAGIFLFVTLPFFHKGFFPTQDDVQVVRIDALAQELRSGQFPVRYINMFGNGGGYMLFEFYSPLVYYVGAFIHIIGISLVKTTKLVFLLGYGVGLAGIVFLLKRYSNWVVTMIGSLLFLTSTYVGYDVYTRGDLGEFWGFMLLPAVFWAFLRLKEEKNRIFILSAGILLGLLILSHTLMGINGAIFLVLLFFIPPLDKQQSLRIFLAVLLGAGLSAFFWLPVLTEHALTWYSQSSFTTLSYKTNFLNPLEISGLHQLSWGFKPPLLGLGLFVGGCLSILFFLIKHKKITPVVRFAGSGFVLSLLLIWDISKPLWDHITYLQYMIFPWRFLSGATVFAVLLIALFLSKVKRRWLQVALGILLLLPAITLQYKYLRPSGYNFISQYFAEDACTSTTWASEYMPRWATECLPKPKNHAQPAYSLIQPTNNSEKVQSLQTKQNGREIEFNVAGTGSAIIASRYFFPGWISLVDTYKVTVSPYGKYGLLSFSVPGGQHHVIIKLTDTPVRTTGNIVSLFSILGICYFLVFMEKTKKRFLKKKKK